jgi:hypothetical protein
MRLPIVYKSMIYWNEKIENFCFVKKDIITLHNNGQL